MFWLDTQDGKLIIGMAAFEAAMPQSFPGDIVPLVELLEQPEFEVNYQDFDRYPRKLNRTEEECIEYGKWVLNVLSESTNTPQLSREHFERLSRLGLGIAWTSMSKTLGNFWEISAQLGAESFSAPGTYDNWSTNDYIENAAKLANHLGRKPVKADYIEWARKGKGPGPRVIWQKFDGDLHELNELIGFPNIRGWSVDEYIDWGVRVMRTNDGQVPTQLVVDIISGRKQGPSYSILFQKFGGFSRYQELVKELYDQQSTEVDVMGHDFSRTLKIFDTHFEAPTISAKEKPSMAARFEVAQDCLPELSKAELAQLAYRTDSKSFIGAIRKLNSRRSAGYIEMVAVSHGLHDLIWPPPNYDKKHLLVTDKQLAAARKKSARRRQRSRLKQAG